jgi:simple sugar transport system permease protein
VTDSATNGGKTASMSTIGADQRDSATTMVAADDGAARNGVDERWRQIAERIAIPLIALAGSAVLFGLFLAVVPRVDPLEVYGLMYQGAFGSWFSWQNTLARAAPLILTALCTALPARLGLVVIGNEGALVVGGVAAAAVGVATNGAAPLVVQIVMAVAGMVVGGLWVFAAGWLRHHRGVNETIASLLLTYIAIALMNHLVEGALRDPESLNKPSTAHIGDANMVGNLPAMDVHWGLVMGVVLCVGAYVLMRHTTFGFATDMVGGNVRAARGMGLNVGRLIAVTSLLGGAAAGLAGMLEVAAVHGRANASLVAGYGYAGILVAFLARHHPLAIIPVAILLGGIGASNGLLQRRLDLPDATVLVLQGVIFVMILASEALYGRIRILQPRDA